MLRLRQKPQRRKAEPAIEDAAATPIHVGVGSGDGALVGWVDGSILGKCDGFRDMDGDWLVVGPMDGAWLGNCDGFVDGESEGFSIEKESITFTISSQTLNA